MATTKKQVIASQNKKALTEATKQKVGKEIFSRIEKGSEQFLKNTFGRLMYPKVKKIFPILKIFIANGVKGFANYLQQTNNKNYDKVNFIAECMMNNAYFSAIDVDIDSIIEKYTKGISIPEEISNESKIKE
jgi:hypothetical protein